MGTVPAGLTPGRGAPDTHTHVRKLRLFAAAARRTPEPRGPNAYFTTGRRTIWR